MKKSITLFIALGTFMALYAQNPREQSRKVIFGQTNNTTRRSTENRRHVVLGTGNQNPYPNNYSNRSGRYSKNQSIRSYPAYRRHSDDRYYKKEKHDNGRHLGWDKGKGNPHKRSEYKKDH